MRKKRTSWKLLLSIAKRLAVLLDKLEKSLQSKAYIRKTPGKREWCVYSESGRRMGCYPSKKKALERLRQIEYFKRIKGKSSDKFIAYKDIVDQLSEFFSRPF